MNKKILYASVLIVLWSENITLADGPSPEEWNDRAGNPVPVLVKQATNKLWDSVEMEQVAARHMHTVAHTFHVPSLSWIWQSATNAVIELITNRQQPQILLDEEAEFDTAQALFIQRSREVLKVYTNFQQIVREHLAGRYWFGDAANDNIYDEWAPDQKWQVKLPSPGQNDYRDMSSIVPATLKFVNAWGGWVRK